MTSLVNSFNAKVAAARKYLGELYANPSDKVPAGVKATISKAVAACQPSFQTSPFVPQVCLTEPKDLETCINYLNATMTKKENTAFRFINSKYAAQQKRFFGVAGQILVDQLFNKKPEERLKAVAELKSKVKEIVGDSVYTTRKGTEVNRSDYIFSKIMEAARGRGLETEYLTSAEVNRQNMEEYATNLRKGIAAQILTPIGTAPSPSEGIAGGYTNPVYDNMLKVTRDEMEKVRQDNIKKVKEAQEEAKEKDKKSVFSRNLPSVFGHKPMTAATKQPDAIIEEAFKAYSDTQPLLVVSYGDQFAADVRKEPTKQEAIQTSGMKSSPTKKVIHLNHPFNSSTVNSSTVDSAAETGDTLQGAPLGVDGAASNHDVPTQVQNSLTNRVKDFFNKDKRAAKAAAAKQKADEEEAAANEETKTFIANLWNFSTCREKESDEKNLNTRLIEKYDEYKKLANVQKDLQKVALNSDPVKLMGIALVDGAADKTRRDLENNRRKLEELNTEIGNMITAREAKRAEFKIGTVPGIVVKPIIFVKASRTIREDLRNEAKRVEEEDNKLEKLHKEQEKLREQFGKLEAKPNAQLFKMASKQLNSQRVVTPVVEPTKKPRFFGLFK